MALRVLIVDDNARFLEAARDLLDREGMTVVGVASTSVDALSAPKCCDPMSFSSISTSARRADSIWREDS